MRVDFQRRRGTNSLLIWLSGLTDCDWGGQSGRSGAFSVSEFMEIICHAKKKLEILVAQHSSARASIQQSSSLIPQSIKGERRTEFWGFILKAFSKNLHRFIKFISQQNISRYSNRISEAQQGFIHCIIKFLNEEIFKILINYVKFKKELTDNISQLCDNADINIRFPNTSFAYLHGISLEGHYSCHCTHNEWENTVGIIV